MADISKKLQKLPQSILVLFSGPPHRYWNWFLLFFALVFIGVIAGNMYIYFRTTGPVTLEESFDPTVRSDKINEKGLEQILSALAEDEIHLEEVLNAAPVKDPSL